MEIEVVVTTGRGRGMKIYSFKAPPSMIAEFDRLARQAGLTRSEAIKLLIKHAVANPELLRRLAGRNVPRNTELTPF
ncbi:hypothetical protein APE_0883a [Aeropyrum pernix spindle-shaped virus 1]|uniref:Ribbon-helix-helix protein CopG domain-containing protein n=2 Tax=root TaxID=1 RepID=Q05E42_AERPE|nr:ribbon-helix-helix protein, CopG family [Aeropyrum pernix]BAF34759.1 hypothetical protein APE_0883a [Aeropyrum pernix spindle-shaped virus 1] [Aeropyrum pernix K1]